MSAAAEQTVEAPGTTSAAIVGHLRTMRSSLRMLAVSALVFTLWLGAYGGAAVLQSAALTRRIGGVSGVIYLLFVGAIVLPTHLLWRQADAASRFVASPSDELFATFAREMRRFWRVSAWAGATALSLTVVWLVLLFETEG